MLVKCTFTATAATMLIKSVSGSKNSGSLLWPADDDCHSDCSQGSSQSSQDGRIWILGSRFPKFADLPSVKEGLSEPSGPVANDFFELKKELAKAQTSHDARWEALSIIPHGPDRGDEKSETSNTHSENGGTAEDTSDNNEIVTPNSQTTFPEGTTVVVPVRVKGTQKRYVSPNMECTGVFMGSVVQCYPKNEDGTIMVEIEDQSGGTRTFSSDKIYQVSYSDEKLFEQGQEVWRISNGEFLGNVKYDCYKRDVLKKDKLEPSLVKVEFEIREGSETRVHKNVYCSDKITADPKLAQECRKKYRKECKSKRSKSKHRKRKSGGNISKASMEQAASAAWKHLLIYPEDTIIEIITRGEVIKAKVLSDYYNYMKMKNKMIDVEIISPAKWGKGSHKCIAPIGTSITVVSSPEKSDD